MGGSGTSSTNQMEAPTAAPMTRTCRARDTGRERAFLPLPFCLPDSIRTSSNMAVSPRKEKTPLLTLRFRRGRRRHGPLSQFQCLLEVLVGRVGVLLLPGRIRIDLGFFSVEQVEVR